MRDSTASAGAAPAPTLGSRSAGSAIASSGAEYGDVWIIAKARTDNEATEPGTALALEKVRQLSLILEDHCRELGRDPDSIERACFTGWTERPSPFDSRASFQEYVGRHQEVGVQRFIFGRVATREVLERFLAQAILDSGTAAETM